MRCNKCRSFNLSDIRAAEIEHQPSLAALKASADAGCSLCSLFFTRIKLSTSSSTVEQLLEGHTDDGEFNHDTPVHVEGLFYDVGRSLSRRYRVVIRVGLRIDVDSAASTPMNALSAELSVYAEPGTPASKYLKSRPINRNPMQGIEVMKDWLQDCDKNHNCISTELPLLPTRVLDVSRVPTVVTTCGERARYIALSYCWGTSGKNVLFTDDTAQMFSTQGIHLDTLPKTIQDAITMTRELGVKYVWIDALCIIQEQQDLRDFKAEAPNMGEYYRNAYVTLSIACAADCSDGFIKDRAPQQAEPCKVEYSPYRKPGSAEQIAPTVAYLCLPAAESTGLLNTRAWAFQESELSNRLLSFGETQFDFLCQQLRQYENGDYLPRAQKAENWDSMTHQSPSLRKILSLSGRMSKDEEISLFDLWTRFVSKYSQRAMTNPDDKLAALSGMAKHVRDAVRCKYMFGIWENDLIKGLLWSTYGFAPRRIPTARKRWPHRAPSWSWASIDGWIRTIRNPQAEALNRDPANWRVQVLSHEGIGDFLDPIRETLTIPKAFELRIEGVLKKVKIFFRSLRASDRRSGGSTHLLVESGLPENLSTQAEVEPYCVGHGTYDVDSDSAITRLEALRLTVRNGLLLEQVDEERYRRVGHFKVEKEAWFEGGISQQVVLI
ncbi:HET-domain-containing protein [Periconia macrospinosa]|uniref:HET-domain-containing protein n=1 Tax=Periconia macrospinosa TaxID=97972 RepID=A0A2V1DS14_9PLEO|nr:HET-domain-containing protein [Periconia macrospinosa]